MLVDFLYVDMKGSCRLLLQNSKARNTSRPSRRHAIFHVDFSVYDYLYEFRILTYFVTPDCYFFIRGLMFSPGTRLKSILSLTLIEKNFIDCLGQKGKVMCKA